MQVSTWTESDWSAPPFDHFDKETFKRYTLLKESAKSLKGKKKSADCMKDLACLAVKLGAKSEEVEYWLKRYADIMGVSISYLHKYEVPFLAQALDNAVLHDNFRFMDVISRAGGFGRIGDGMRDDEHSFSVFVHIARSYGDKGLPAAKELLQDDNWWKMELHVPMGGYTPLMHAAKNNAKGLVKLFLDCGEKHANAAYINRLEESALLLAAEHEDQECAEMIKAHLLNNDDATKRARYELSKATERLDAATSAAMARFEATKQAALARKEEELKRKRMHAAGADDSAAAKKKPKTAV